MIKGVFNGFGPAVRAMQNAQWGMQISSQNVAGASDPTYTKRTAMTGPDGAQPGPGILRSRNTFIDDQYRQANSTFGYADAKHEMLTRVEDIFADPVNAGMRKAIDGFFDAWQGLVEHPQDHVARLEVLRTGETLTVEVRSAYARVSDTERSVNEDLKTKVDNVNRLTGQIYDLNIRVTTLERNSQPSADLRDLRDKALDELAKLTGSKAVEDPGGMVRVYVGGTTVIDGPTIQKLELQTGASGPTPMWTGFPTSPYQGSGAIDGLIKVRDEELTKLKTEINALAQGIVTQVNTVHQQGYGLTDNVQRPFFNPITDAGNIKVNPALTTDMIAAASSPGLPGDNSNALKLAQVRDAQAIDSTLYPGQKVSPRTFYRNLVGWVGSQTKAAGDAADLATAHIATAEKQRQQKWGVNIDEEMADLAMQQKAFAAAARVFTVMDEMLDQLVNRTGLVGR